ncbi:MAG: DUF1573 domain-containing protein [Saprospiraceae bacterium]|nr:DUF1573 domain-containing protein [Saprospiraceae bacterium]
MVANNKNWLIVFSLFLMSGMSVYAQSLGEMRPYLDTLTVEQKLQVLEYMRHQGASLDREVAQSYLQLDKDKQERTLQYIRLQLLKKVGEAEDRTTVRISRDTLFLGKLEEGEIILDSFLVTNTGARPYVIRDVKASCDCTVLRRPAYPLMPGETAAIRVEFDTRGKIGLTTPGIVLFDNSRPNGRQIVY